MSPYSYALNNPIRFIDVDGMYAGESGIYQKGDKEFDDVLTYSGITGSPEPKGDQDGDGKKKGKE